MNQLLKTVFFLALAVQIFFTASTKAEVPIKIFSDFGYVYDNNAANNSFQIHDVDLFLSGNIDKNVSYLAEINFQPSFSSLETEIERTYLQYQFSPWLKVSLGRFHTALGYWNDTYHHGGYLQTSASRPTMEQFEDSGGLLPVHTTGVEIRGRGKKYGEGTLGYLFNVGNGRGPVKDPTSSFNSYSKSKSLSGGVYYEFENGMRVGGNFWRSDLPGGTLLANDTTPATYTNSSGSTVLVTGPKGVETIYGMHFIYSTPEYEWLSEYNLMLHHYDAGSSNANGSADTTIHFFYSQFGYHLGPYFTPFVRYELDSPSTYDAYLNANPGYRATGLPATLRQLVAGTRYELSASSALKLEFTYLSSGAPIFLTDTPNPNNKLTDWRTNLNWSFVW